MGSIVRSCWVVKQDKGRNVPLRCRTWTSLMTLGRAAVYSGCLRIHIAVSELELELDVEDRIVEKTHAKILEKSGERGEKELEVDRECFLSS